MSPLDLLSWSLVTAVVLCLAWIVAVVVREFFKPTTTGLDLTEQLLAVWVDLDGRVHFHAPADLDENFIGELLVDVAAQYASDRPTFREVG